MAKVIKEKPGSTKDPGPQKGYTRLMRRSVIGGFIDLPKSDADRLLALEESMGVKNYETNESNDGTDSGADKGSEE